VKALVLYYTRSGNTRRIAEVVAAALKADIEEIRGTVAYSGMLGLVRGGVAAAKGKPSGIEALQHDPAAYDLVVLGQPVWAAHPVPAVVGLALTGKLAGRRVALFVTCGGSGADECLKRTAELLKPSAVASQTVFVNVRRQTEEKLGEARAWAVSLAQPQS
jgi:flavodoxin